MKADYPLRFVNSVINGFLKGKDRGDKRIIVPSGFFGITKVFTSIGVLYCDLSEVKLKHSLKKIHKITNDSFKVTIYYICNKL